MFNGNQTYYFLHAFAQLDNTHLGRDWVANTLDTCPLFTWVASLILRFGTEGLIYCCGALLAGILLVSLVRIGCHSDRRVDSSHCQPIVALGLVAIFSEAIDWTFYKLTGVRVLRQLTSGLGAQQLLSPAFEPASFDVLLAASVLAFLKRRKILASFLVSLTASFHPSFLFSSGLLVAAYAAATYADTRDLRSALSYCGWSLLFVSPVVTHTLFTFAGTLSPESQTAQEILFSVRIPHHADPRVWSDPWMIVKLVGVTAAVYVQRGNRLAWVLGTAAILSTALTILQLATGSKTLALLFPWRVFALLVPLSYTVVLAWLAGKISTAWRNELSAHSTWLHVTQIACLIVLATAGLGLTIPRFAKSSTQPNRELYSFVKKTTTPDDRYLIPIGKRRSDLVEFRLRTGAPILVDWKSVPYGAPEIVEWHARFEAVSELYRTRNCERLQQLARKYDLSHIVVRDRLESWDCKRIELLYRNARYDLGKINPVAAN